MIEPFNDLEFFAHFPTQMSPAIKEYTTEEALKRSRYIFTKRMSGLQYGYCTHCRKSYRTSRSDGKEGLKHNQNWKCLKCSSLCVVKGAGMGRKKLVDTAYFVYYEKSVKDREAIVARGIYVVRDYSGDYHETETQYYPVALYLFKPGYSKMAHRYAWSDTWWERKSICSESDNSMKNVYCSFSKQSIAEAVKGTPFQYSTWDKYEGGDMVRFFDLAAKYPCIEYLTKLGLRRLVEAKLYGHPTYRAVNWREKTIEKVLRLTKTEIKNLFSSKIVVEPSTLHCYHLHKKNGAQITFDEAHMLKDVTDGYYAEELKKLRVYASFKQISKYILKQLRRKSKKHYVTSTSVITAWRDYIKDCKELGMDVEKESVLFPNDLYEAHQKTIRQVKIKADETLNFKIAKRVIELEKFIFEYNGFILRPAHSSIELFDEGKALEHCVGRYAQRYAEGNTNLFVLRKADEPAIPFFTVEVINQEVIQVRGKSNCNPSEDVKAFMEAFKAEKLSKKSRKKARSA